jgi:hypothetical protein
MTSFYPSGNALRRAIRSLRQEDLGTFAYKLASETGFRRVLLLERPLDDPIADPAPALPVDFAMLGAHEIDDYLVLRPDADRAHIAAHLASGWTCHVLRHDGRIVSACWRADSPYWSSYLERTMPIADGDAYLTDAWTDAGYRGHALAHVLCLHQLRDLREKGFRRALRGTVPENRSALRAHAKSGFRPIAVLGRIRIGPWRGHFRREWREA